MALSASSTFHDPREHTSQAIRRNRVTENNPVLIREEKHDFIPPLEPE